MQAPLLFPLLSSLFLSSPLFFLSSISFSLPVLCSLFNQELAVYCDGAARGNGSQVARAGAAACSLASSLSRRVPGAQTNARAELLAACLALQLGARARRLRVLADSAYVLDGVARELAGRRAASHADLWLLLSRLLALRHDRGLRAPAWQHGVSPLIALSSFRCQFCLQCFQSFFWYLSRFCGVALLTFSTELAFPVRAHTGVAGNERADGVRRYFCFSFDSSLLFLLFCFSYLTG